MRTGRWTDELEVDASLVGALFEAVGAGLYAVDETGRVSAATPEMERLLGYGQGEVTGELAHALVHQGRHGGQTVAAEQCPVLAVARTGLPARSDDDVFWRRDGSPLPVWWTATPLVRPGRPTGVAVVFGDASLRQDALQRQARLLAKQHARVLLDRDRLGLLAQLGEALTTLDVDEGLRRLARLSVGRVADWCVVDRLDEAGSVVRAAVARRDPGPMPEEVRPQVLGPVTLRSLGPLARVLAGGEAQVVPDVQKAVLPEVRADRLDAAQAALFARIGAASALIAPLRTRQQVVGALTWVRLEPAEPFSDADVLLAAEFGRRAGLALENARLHSLTRSAGEELQRSLLTAPPEPDHMHLVVRYLPAAEGSKLGGDWYDSLLLADGSTAIIIGDVAGHDVAAAARMAQLRNMLRFAAYDIAAPPSEVLTRLDRALAGLGVDATATVVLARVEQTPEEREQGLRRLVWSNAGHPPPLLLHPDGTVETLDRGGDLLLGADPDIPRRDHEVVLPPRSTVLLYTDGLIERRAATAEQDLARLRQALGALADQPLEVLADQLLERLLSQGGTDDDVALIAVRLHPEDQARPVEAGPQRLRPGPAGS
ncbi:MAG: SpoIIE family protein phosphatase [Actinomycetota bacterium]|nr:SpoIIE family protein phosphatase [Actinomycetota bacterium]